MSHSVRLAWIDWWRQRRNLFRQRVHQLLGYVVVEPKSRDNSVLLLEFAARIDAGSAGGQTHNVLTAPITAGGNAVDGEFPTFSQINEGNCWSLGLGQSGAPVSGNLQNLNERGWGVQR